MAIEISDNLLQLPYANRNEVAFTISGWQHAADNTKETGAFTYLDPTEARTYLPRPPAKVARALGSYAPTVEAWWILASVNDTPPNFPPTVSLSYDGTISGSKVHVTQPADNGAPTGIKVGVRLRYPGC